MNHQLPLQVVKSSTGDGQRLDVAGLNEITVLIDRSRTALTEVGINRWHSGLEGPPHFHDSKEQIFYVLNGTATITVGRDAYRVRPGDLIYVPRGTMHRTVVDAGKELVYLLFNAFSDEEKEGHASFADHIAKVKQTRRRQADEAADGAAVDWVRSDGNGIHVAAESDATEVSETATRLVNIRSLIAASATFRCSADLVRLAANGRWLHDLMGNTPVEKTHYVLEGAATVRVDGEAWPVTAGDLIYVPEGRNVTIESGDGGVELLSLQTFVDRP